jgi:protein O-mannosyl-transferase
MKKRLQIILTFLLIPAIFPSLISAQEAKPRVLGVVMGISKYQNVPSLQYADRDAMSFYNFLLSTAGGKADTNNIRLLLNEKATSYNFFEAMDNLLDMAKENDVVYVYFAGHGDIEKKTERQNGFLIGYNAPPNCYAAGGCISVKFLQDYVETLVSKNKSKVVLIVDACRSGKLAGGTEGAEITALSLKAEWKGVVKILSCQPGEVSFEGEKWGDGSGVFTYFMLRGLKGMADENNDEKIEIRELSYYMDKNVPKETGNKQMPEIVGDKRFEIATVDKPTLMALTNRSEPEPLAITTTSSGFETNYSSIKDVSIIKDIEKFKHYINNNNLISYSDDETNKENAYSVFRSLESRRGVQTVLLPMKRELLAALQNKAQKSVNNWMNSIADTGNISGVYEELKTAYSLIDSTHPQYIDIKTLYMFWSGRLLGRADSNRAKIMEEIIKFNPEFVFSYVDIGAINSSYNKDYFKAIKYFDKAIEINQDISEVWSYKGLAIADLGKYDEAIKCYDKVIELKPNDINAIFSKGNALLFSNKSTEAIKCYN